MQTNHNNVIKHNKGTVKFNIFRPKPIQFINSKVKEIVTYSLQASAYICALMRLIKCNFFIGSVSLCKFLMSFPQNRRKSDGSFRSILFDKKN